MMNGILSKFRRKARGQPRRSGTLKDAPGETTKLEETIDLSQDNVSTICISRKRLSPEPPSVCQFCSKPFTNNDDIHKCLNHRKHAFCSGCIQQYIENWMEDETWPELKQQSDGSFTLPCLLNDQDEHDGRDFHYLPTRTIRNSIPADLMRRLETKMDLVSRLMGSVREENDNYADATIVESSILTKTTALSGLHSTGATLQHSPEELPTLTCHCCFEDIVQIPDAAVTGYHCTVGAHHFFCISCIRKYVEEWVYGGTMSAAQLKRTPDGGWALSCLAPGDELPLGEQPNVHCLPTASIEPCVSAPVFQRFMEKIEAVTLRQQQNDQVPDGKKTASHSFYHQAAEALTEALMRRCPSCHTQFFKEDGSCNKVRCPHCDAVMCYICRQTLSGRKAGDYSHFCKHSEKNCQICSRCPLWSIDYELDDQKRRQSVAADVANRAWETVLLSPATEKGDVLENDIQRSIDRLI